MDKRADLAVAFGFLLFGGWLLWASERIPQGSVPDSIGSGGVARVLAIGIILLSGYLIVRRFISWRHHPGRLAPPEGAEDSPEAPASAWRGLGMFAALVGYAIAIKFVGYPIASPIFVLIALIVMRVRSAMKLTVIPIAYTLVTYTLFVGVFGVLLPLGVLSRWDFYLWFHF